jgi:hypothetical protein
MQTPQILSSVSQPPHKRHNTSLKYKVKSKDIPVPGHGGPYKVGNNFN